MTEHYYSANPQSAHAEREFTAELLGNSLRFATDAGVFSRGDVDYGTRLLVSALPNLSGKKFLDLACGWGAVGIAIAKRYPTAQIFMTDVNARAIVLAKQNARANGVSPEILMGDGADGLPDNFDAIALNPPIRAGKAVVYRLFTESAQHLQSDGTLYIVIRKQQGAPSAKKYLSTLFCSVESIARSDGYHVFACTARRSGACAQSEISVDNSSVDNV